MSKLAIHGGQPAIRHPFPKYNPYGEEERKAAIEVIESGVLSKFIGAWDEDFYGGEKIRSFESSWSKHFKVQHSVTVNSATSGLIAAVGALDVEPGDEIIVSPWTMCASATAILVWNCIPVFADIETKTFNLDPADVERKITSRTRAIMVPDIFGHAADLDAIIAIAKRHGLKVIEDASQSPNALYKGRYAGTIADIGVFSLNYHKHIHTGEGGVCVTNDPALAERMQMIRNHAEAAVKGRRTPEIHNMVGFNFRLGEIEAAMGIEQLKKLPFLAQGKFESGKQLAKRLAELDGITPGVAQPDCTHVYYVFPMILDAETIGIPREKIARALEAEGVTGLMTSYASVHLLPMYQRRVAFGKQGHPWNLPGKVSNVSYEKGICPVTERLNDTSWMGLEFCLHWFTASETKLIGDAFEKVWSGLKDLR